MRFLLSCFVLFNSFIATSQNYLFSHLSSGFDEYPYSSASTPDSGFVIAGYTKESTQNWALYVNKYDKVGTKEWGYQYDGSSSKKDLLHDIVLASDSGFLISGRTWSYLTMGGDSYIIKLDKNGNHLFTTVVDGKSTHWYNAGLAIDEMSNGEIIQAGMYHMAYNPVRYDWEINRFSSTGVHLNTFFIGLLNGNEYATDVLAIDSGQYLMAGFTETSTTGDDFGFFHADSNDNNLYFASYSGSGDERCMQIIRNSDNTYYLAGFTDSYGAGGIDFAVIKLDSVWNILWQKTYGGTGNDELIAACSDGNGGLVLGGYTDGYNAQGTDNLLVRIDSSGNTIKSIAFGGGFDDEIYSLSLDKLGNYIIQSKTNSFTNGGINDIFL
ncbi:MAG TPA: hypothetical protein EYQ86_05295, partial [Bacteroidetes bacterium]|nr:hypothetical protein [Bacteroidota bacterium]